MIGSAWWHGALLTVGAAASVVAQALPDPVVAHFADSARAGTARYQDRTVAVADGYRPIGPESPAMGQHWVNARLLLDGTFDPARPAILTYVLIEGSPRLAGVAYARALGPGDPDPRSPVGEDAWHFHSSSVADEALLIHHEHHGAQQVGAARIGVLHAWVWITNPQGIFVPDNWALPFVRMGLEPPNTPDTNAARALALGVGGVKFFAQQYGIMADLDSVDRAEVREGLSRNAARLNDWLRERGKPGAVGISQAEQSWLTALWETTTRDLKRRLSCEGWRRLEAAMREP